MLKQIINYLKNNQIDCHADKSARNDRVCHYGRFAFYRKSAFTLAETLVVIGIIGVVAALTLPNLNSSTGDKEKVVKLQKIYSNLQDAFGRAEVTYGPYRTWFASDGNNLNSRTKRIFERMTQYMKYSKVCTVNDNCRFKFNTGVSAGEETQYGVILSDGTTIGFENCFASNICYIYVDLDGFNKGANSPCKDVFKFGILDGNITYGARSVVESNNFIDNTDNALGSVICAAWVINSKNMDYLKLNSSGKCPDGQNLQFGVKTTCK